MHLAATPYTFSFQPLHTLTSPAPCVARLQVVKNTRAGETYLLYQCGTPNPQTTNTELDLPAGTKVFQIPLVSVAVTDSNAAAFLVSAGWGSQPGCVWCVVVLDDVFVCGHQA